MTLDNKLKEIITNITTDHDSNTLSDKIVDLYVAEIKQAFTDEGWKKIGRHEIINQRLRDRVVSGELMTGQEWYERFEKELAKKGLDFNDFGAINMARKAAKRASGL